MKKETILKLFNKKQNQCSHYYKGNEISISNILNDKAISIEIEIESKEDFIDIRIKKDCNIFFD